MRNYIYALLILLASPILAQKNAVLIGEIKQPDGLAVPFANVFIKSQNLLATSDSTGHFVLKGLKTGQYTLSISAISFKAKEYPLSILKADTLEIIIELTPEDNQLNEVVVSGTMKEVSRANSVVPVEIYTAKFFQRNPTPTIFDGLQIVNGVRPQLNCSVCNTGDIHINGMEGPYTMITIDGMPIVSGLSSVYGLHGIPNSIVDRIEIIKGPASMLYGSEAVGGLINIITKSGLNAPRFSLDVNATSYQDFNTDFSFKHKIGRATSLVSGNYFHFNKRWDINQDNFTDVALSRRVSIFNKWQFQRQENRVANFAWRYINEERFGGEMQWQRPFRGGDSIYGESIYTQRLELLGNYQLPFKDKVMLAVSYNWHNQNSAYGNTLYLARQQVAFSQLTWNAPLSKKHDLLMGAALRYIYYDDNTPATADEANFYVNKPSHTTLPGIFIQDEMDLNAKNKLLLGVRYDYNSQHGSILTPRLNYKWSPDISNTLRVSLGSGYRVVNIFTEEHAALTGAREVLIINDLKPEKSYNVNVNYTKKFYPSYGFITFDGSLFYTYFNNKIIADYLTDPQKIIYDNLKGYGISRGASVNMDFNLTNGLKIISGFSLTDVFTTEGGVKQPILHNSLITANWSVSYTVPKVLINIDFTGNLNSPMHLPVLPNDFRPEQSPWFSLMNIQLSKSFKNNIEIYGGVKNLLNFIPQNPIMRPFDPFDKTANDPVSNPNGYTFDPTYNYAPIQGIRGFIGFRYSLR